MRNKLGIIPIKIRAKNPEDIDLTSVGDIVDSDIIIDGDIKSLQNGKLCLLDIYIKDDNDERLEFYGITFLAPTNVISVCAFNSEISKSCQIELTLDNHFSAVEYA